MADNMNAYAVIDDGGKQYTVKEGDLVRVELKSADAGAEVRFDKVLMVAGPDGAKIGKPSVDGAAVVCVVQSQEKGPKVRGLKRRNVSRSITSWGHRQKYTLLKVTKIES